MEITLNSVTAQEGSTKEEILNLLESQDISAAFPDGYEAEVADSLDVTMVEIEETEPDTYAVCLYANNVTVGTQRGTGDIIHTINGINVDVFVKPD